MINFNHENNNKNTTPKYLQQDVRDDMLVDDNGYISAKTKPTNNCINSAIENLMDTIIKERHDKITINISLTKSQYEEWLKKGGEIWLKKILLRKRCRGK